MSIYVCTYTIKTANAFAENGYRIGTSCVSDLHFKDKEPVSSPLCQKQDVQCLHMSGILHCRRVCRGYFAGIFQMVISGVVV